MKNYTLFLWIALLMLGISGTIGAREVASFNDGWEFKKGPFSRSVAGCTEMEFRLAGGIHPTYLECGRHAKASLRFL